MSILSAQIESYLLYQNKMQRMLKAGEILLKVFGEENICDFSIGYSKERPSEQILACLRTLVSEIDIPKGLGYLPNEGEYETRKLTAEYFNSTHQTHVSERHLILTCGAAGGLNCLLRSILSPGDEVLCLSPGYPEYEFNIKNFGGVYRIVPTLPERNFHLDLNAFASSITERTRCVILNIPNNPTGTIYTTQEMTELASLLTDASNRNSRPIVLAVDESCSFITYDNHIIPDIFALYPYSSLICSFSKNLALAGERLGYVVVNPAMHEWKKLMEALAMSNRILGYINAPVIGQRLLRILLKNPPSPDKDYEGKRNHVAEILDEAGIKYTLPEGSFFFFPQVPGKTSGDFFASMLALQKIFVISGSLYGNNRHFRLAFCTDHATIERSRNGFKRASKLAKLLK